MPVRAAAPFSVAAAVAPFAVTTLRRPLPGRSPPPLLPLPYRGRAAARAWGGLSPLDRPAELAKGFA